MDVMEIMDMNDETMCWHDGNDLNMSCYVVRWVSMSKSKFVSHMFDMGNGLTIIGKVTSLGVFEGS